MARWSADGKEVAEEVRAALLPGGALPPGPAEAYVHIRAGIGSLLGDTHVLVAGGRVRVVGRRTSLDPLTETELAGRPRLDDSGYRPVLILPTRDGDQRVEVTSLEEPAVEDLLGELPPVSLGARGGTWNAPGAATPGASAPASSPDGELPDLATARAALIGSLARRLKQRRAELVARRHARKTASLDHRAGVHRGAPPPSPRGGTASAPGSAPGSSGGPRSGRSDERWRARHEGAARRAAKREAAVVSNAPPPAPLLARLAVVAIAGVVVFFLFAFLGRALSGQP